MTPTSTVVARVPAASSPGAGRQSISNTKRQTAQLERQRSGGADQPGDAGPSALYSSASIVPSIRVLAPSVRRIAAS